MCKSAKPVPEATVGVHAWTEKVGDRCCTVDQRRPRLSPADALRRGGFVFKGLVPPDRDSPPCPGVEPPANGFTGAGQLGGEC